MRITIGTRLRYDWFEYGAGRFWVTVFPSPILWRLKPAYDRTWFARTLAFGPIVLWAQRTASGQGAGA